MMDTSSFMRLNITLLRIGGLYSAEKKEGRSTSLILLRLWVNICVFLFICSSMVDLSSKDFLNDTTSAALNCQNIAGAVYVLFRVNYFYSCDYKCESLVKQLSSLLFSSTDAKESEIRTLDKALKFTDKFTKYYAIFCYVSSHAAVMIWPIITYHKERIFPIPMWYPYERTATPYYELTMLSQEFILLLMITLTVGPDSFFIALLLNTLTVFDILEMKIQSLIELALPRSKMLDEINDSQSDNKYYSATSFRMETDEELDGKLRELIVFHNDLLSLCSNLEDFFSPVMLIVIPSSIMIILFTGYLISFSRDLSFLLFGIGLISFTIAEVLNICLLGQLLTSQNEKLRNYFYSVPWYVCGRKFQTNFKMMQARMNKNVTLTVAKFADLTLNMFVWILRTVVSYITILHQFTQER